mmetsp:Transcript_15748/g.24160  ORF Transcript_15748/g.24160 Transcript_15748/m.24160 type:complete len:522 (-) Transcript_15748:95-1660(-)
MFVLTPRSERSPLTAPQAARSYVTFTTSSEVDEEKQRRNEQPTRGWFSRMNCFRNCHLRFNPHCCVNALLSMDSFFFRSINTMTFCKLVLFCLFEWNFYLTMKMIYPFDAYFATFYGFSSMTTFSFITGSYDLGSFITILFTLIPCIPLRRISIRSSLLCIFLLNALVQFMHTYVHSFLALFALRLSNGMLGTIAWSQITGSIGAFLHNPYDRTLGIIIHESSSLLSTLSFLPVGFILSEGTVNLCWYILAAFSLCFALLSWLVLPSHSVYTTSIIYHRSRQIMIDHNENHTVLANIERVDTLHGSTCSKSKCVHLTLLYCTVMLTQFPFMMFYATFGPWMTQEFNLGPAKLGLETLSINLGELLSLMVTLILAKKVSNAFSMMLGSFGFCFVAVFFAILLDTNFYCEWLVLVLICLSVMFKEIVILNAIICTLSISPLGYENITALVFLLFMNMSSMTATIVGSDIVEMYSFPVLLRINAIICLIQLLVSWQMNSVHRSYEYRKQRTHSLSTSNDHDQYQ